MLCLSDLNRRKDVAEITIKTLSQYNLSMDELTFIEKYIPEIKLIIYGTLAPGKPNHHKISHIKGDWKPAVLKGGKLENKGWGADLGFNGYVPAKENEQTNISCYVLFSDELMKNWEILDEFEGAGYKRILAEYELENGENGVGYVYGINQ